MDKKNQPIDLHFIDKSWANMSQLLDQEMPVKKRKKRFFWLWFGGFATLLLLGFFMIFGLNTSTDTTPKIEVEKQEKITNIDTEKTDNQPLNSINSSRKISSAPKKNKVKKASIDKKINKSANHHSKNLPSIKEPENTFKQPTLESSINEKEILFNELANDLSVAAIPPLEQRKKNTNSILNFPTIPLLPIEQFLLLPLQQINPIQNINQRESTNSKWFFGIYAGGLTAELGSYRLGINANVNLKPRWTLHFGLGYASRSRIIPFQKDIVPTEFPAPNPEFPVEEEDGSPMEVEIETTAVEEELPSNENFKLSKYNYFELPVLIQYKLTPKLSLDFGGQISYLHSLQYEQSGEKFQTSHYTDLLSVNSPQLNSDIATINYTAIGGLSYQLSSKFSIYSTYQFSTPYIKSTANSDINKRWKQIEIGARFYFKQ